MSRSQGAPALRGAEIIREIRGNGLPTYWPRAKSKAVFVAHSQTGRKVAELTLSRRDVEGGYAGQKRSEARGRRFSEQWQLSDDAITGKYLGPAGRRGEITTTINLRAGKVTVRHYGPRGILMASATAEAPANYIPEGMMFLAIRRVAALGEKATFKTLINVEAIREGHVRFASVVVSPDGRRRIDVHVGSGAHPERRTYQLDERGNIGGFEAPTDGGSITYKLVR